MKTMTSNVLWKRTIIGVCATILVFVAACFAATKDSVVRASTDTGETVEGFYYVGYAKNSVTDIFGSQENIPVATGEYANWLFAGWYTDNTCTTPVTTTTEIPDAGAYAKFVNPDVLSLKLQVNSDAATAESTNLRLVSSVDSLNYQRVGFKVSYNGNAPMDVYTSTVYKRIMASAAAGVSYKYSPKVVGTESEYFVTATLLNVNSNNYNKSFYIEPYWITFDGVTVCGVSKDVKIEDGLTATTINTTVAANLPEGSTYDVTYGTNGTATATVVSCDGTYANINISLSSGSKTALNSVTTFTIENGDSDIEVLYRNLFTKYTGTGTADTSWYDEYDETATDKYVIATSADLYGMESLANAKGKTFSNKKVYMVADITVNEGTASIENGWQQKSGTTRQYWYAIRKFAGTFDGQNHVISGLYGECTTNTSSEHYADGIGLFTETTGATIRNLSVKNSYYTATKKAGTGAIVGKGTGTFENIYTDIVINSTKGSVGGIIGIATGEINVSNCWSDSDIKTTAAYNGGILGTVSSKDFNITIQHCLNTGSIMYNGTGNSYAGGLVGRANTASATGGLLKIEDSLSVGTVDSVKEETYAGGLLAFASKVVDGKETTVISNSYCVTNGTATYGVVSAVGVDNRNDKTGGTFMDYQEVYDMNAFSNTDLSFEGYVADGYWAIRDDNTPMLVSFLDQEDKTIGTAGRSKTEFVIVDGVGYISTLEQLESFRDQQNAGTLEFAEGDKAVMTDDIEVNEDADAAAWAAGTATKPTAWTSIDSFSGTFDGGGYAISGLYVYNKGQGLFSTLSGATIENLKVTNSYYVAYSATPGTGVITDNGYGTFRNIYTDVIMSSTKNSVGGIIGIVKGDVEVSNCWSSSDITTSGQYCGGIMGNVSKTGFNITIEHCLNTGDITYTGTKNSHIGGLVGRANVATPTGGLLTVEDCLNVGVVSGTQKQSYMGGLLGFASKVANNMETTVVIDSYSATSDTGITVAIGKDERTTTDTGATAVPYADLLGDLALTNADGLDYVSETNTTGYWATRTDKTPMLTYFLDLSNAIDAEEAAKNTFVLKDNKGTISNAAQLASFRDQMNAGTLAVDSATEITLTNDIVMNEGDATEWAAGTNLPTGWVPIYGFSGIFDGGGYTISGLYSNVNYKVGTTFYGTGLFTNAVNATIQNLKIENCYLDTQSTSGTGVVVGCGTGTLKNIYTEAIIKDSLGKGRMGGIIGKANGTVTIENCWSNCTMESAKTYVGGIIGYSNAQNVTISHCLNTGALTYTGTGNSYFGGIVGSSCSTSATADFTTSLLKITDCLNVGTISGTSAQTFMGGVIGNAGGVDGDGNATVVIENSYSSINLDESNNVVGVNSPVGNNYGDDFASCESVAYENLLGELAYSSTQLDFVTESDTTGYWKARENDTPILKDFFQ